MINQQNTTYSATLNIEYYLALSDWNFQETVALLAYFLTKSSGHTDQDYLNKLYDYHYQTYSDIFRRDCRKSDFPVKNLAIKLDEEVLHRYGEKEYAVCFIESTICKEKFVLWATARDIPMPEFFMERLQKSIFFTKTDNECHEDEKDFVANNVTQIDNVIGLTVSDINDAALKSKNPDIQGAAVRLYGALFAGIIITTHPKLKKEDFVRELKKAGFKGDLNIPTKVFDSIWSAIPKTLKNGGRPTEEKKAQKSL